MRRGLFFLFVLFFYGAVCAQPVWIDFFYEPGCHDCERIKAEILPELGKRFGDACVIQPHDIGIETNFIYLLQLEDEIGHMGPERAYLIVGKKHVFGSSPNPPEVFSLISTLLEQGQDGSIGDAGDGGPIN